MTVSTIKMTARQFLMLGEDPPGVRLELVDGEVAVSPSPAPEHSYADRMLSHILLTHILQRGLGILIGDVDTVFGEHNVRRPDLIFYSNGRLHLVRRSAPLKHPPDLCVEIVSPGSVETDRKDKFEQYAAGDVAFYWIVDPNKRTIEGYRLVSGKYELAGRGSGNQAVRLPPFEELQIPLAQLWLPQP
jgi:Uma2 family endonuclease